MRYFTKKVTFKVISLLLTSYYLTLVIWALFVLFTVTWKLCLSKKMELTRGNFRAMIYYDFRRGLSRQEYIDQLISTFGDEAPSYANVKRWYNEFNRGRHLLTDEFHKNRPKSVIGSENVNAVQKLIVQDRHVTYCRIEGTLGISSTSVWVIPCVIYTIKFLFRKKYVLSRSMFENNRHVFFFNMIFENCKKWILKILKSQKLMFLIKYSKKSFRYKKLKRKKNVSNLKKKIIVSKTSLFCYYKKIFQYDNHFLNRKLFLLYLIEKTNFCDFKILRIDFSKFSNIILKKKIHVDYFWA